MPKQTQLETIEQTRIAGKIYSSVQVLGDMAIAWTTPDTCTVFIKESIQEEAELYTIEDAMIEEVFFPSNHTFVLLKTEKSIYVRDFNNEPLEEANYWADYYFEPYTNSFYRKDERGNWYDIEGYRMDVPIFLKGQVLCSLIGKVSRKSLAFKGRTLLISPHQQLVQIGKLVYDNQLNLVNYFGEKITGLGAKNISFGGTEVLQEVHLGLNQSAFINEFTKWPFLLNNEEISQHLETIIKGKHRYEVFQSRTRKYVVEDRFDCLCSVEDTPISLDWTTYLVIGQQQLILAELPDTAFVVDLQTKQPFTLPTIEDRVVYIAPKPILIEKELCYNVQTNADSFVYNATRGAIFTLENETIQPESLEEIEGFTTYLGYAIINKKRTLFYKKRNQVVRLGSEDLTIQQINSQSYEKLLNALDSTNSQVVIDARQGLNQLALAHIDRQHIVEVFRRPHTIGNKILQNVSLQSVGGTVPRIINLNTPLLTLFTLPDDLTENLEQPTPSNFAGNPLTELDFENPIIIDGVEFLSGQFLSFLDQIHPLILQQKNGYPIQLDSVGSRMELVSSFKEPTIQKSHFLGEHRIIGTRTLTEHLQEKELLFSLDTMSNFLPFYDAYLPVFKRIVELRSSANWEYHLFELRGVGSTIEFVAVEKQAPYRLLVEQQKGKPVPKIVKSTEKILKSPEEITAIRQFFLLDPRYSLVGVD